MQAELEWSCSSLWQHSQGDFKPRISHSKTTEAEFSDEGAHKALGPRRSLIHPGRNFLLGAQTTKAEGAWFSFSQHLHPASWKPVSRAFMSDFYAERNRCQIQKGNKKPSFKCVTASAASKKNPGKTSHSFGKLLEYSTALCMPWKHMYHNWHWEGKCLQLGIYVKIAGITHCCSAAC